METGLSGKTVLLTGASGSIGSAIAEMLDKEDSNIILAYNNGENKIKELEKKLKNKHYPVSSDLTNEKDVKRLFLKAESHYGRIDTLIACAGAWSDEKYISDRSLEEWNRTFRLNSTADFLLTRGFLNNLKKYKENHGSIVYIGSTAGIIGEAGHHDYAASKSAIIYGLTQSIKNEITKFAKFGRVNSVCPGWCATPMTLGLLDDKKFVRTITSTIPLKKVARTEDVASTVVFLSSDLLAGHVTGEIITVSGGMEGRLLHGKIEMEQ
jgi:3-oxoacyl-[acyl-carrier protein] reductase